MTVSRWKRLSEGFVPHQALKVREVTNQALQAESFLARQFGLRFAILASVLLGVVSSLQLWLVGGRRLGSVGRAGLTGACG